MANAQHFPEHYYSSWVKSMKRKKDQMERQKVLQIVQLIIPNVKWSFWVLAYFFHKDSEI